MSEIVYTETEQDRGHVANMSHGRTATDKKVTIFQSRDKVALVTSRLVAGVPRRYSDKRYYYWQSVSSLGFRRNKNGTIIPFQCSRAYDAKRSDPWKHMQARYPFELLGGDDNSRMAEEFRRAVWFVFDVTKTTDIYPMMDRYDLLHYHTIPHTLHKAFRQDAWGDYAAAAFGKTRVTPRLINAARNTDPYFVAYAQNFRGLVHDSQLVAFMERNHFDDEMEEGFQPHTPDFRAGILHAHQDVRNALINTKIDLSDMKRIWHVTSVQKKYLAHSFKGNSNRLPQNWTEVRAW